MFHWFGVVTNTKGDSLPNWQVECVQLADGVTVVPIYADENLTPILTASGIADRAKSDSSGNYDFFVPEGTYSLRFYDANGVFQRLQRYLPMYGNAPEAAIAAMEDAQAAQAAAEVAQGLAEDAQAAAEAASELAQTTAGGTVYATWADLAAATGMTAGDSAVVFEDAGTHTDPVVGGTVANAGIYIYSASPAGWERVADTEAVKAADSAVLSQAWAEGTLPGGAGTKSAKEWSENSEASADAAALSAATAEAIAGPTYASTAAGLAATTSGQAFAVDAGGGLVSVYLNSSGTAVLQRTLATTAALAASDGSALVGFSQSATGAVARTVQAKLRDTVSVKDFGAVGDGVTDDTAALKAAFDYAIPLAIPVEMEGTYLVTGPIQPYASRASGSAHIICKGHVVINVSGGATAFRDLFYLETAASNSCSITGGSLSINCNNKAASGIMFRHNAASQSGTVNISCPVEVLNCYNNDAGATYENQGIAVFGDYETVVIERPRVVGVSRASVNGACKGISISGFSGVVTINQPYAANVLTGAGTIDADGIATFGKILGTTYNARGGIANINEPVFVDCQGRSLKSQCSDTTVFRPRVFRKDVVSIVNSVDFDFQTGGQALVIEPYYEYRINGSTSPLGASHTCVLWSQNIDNIQNFGKSFGGVLRTEVLVPRYSSVTCRTGAFASHAEVDGLVVIPAGALTTNAINRAIIEFQANEVEAKSTKTFFAVRNCRGPIGVYAVGYTGYGGSALTSKLSFEINDNTNTLSTPTLQTFANLSGSVITAVEKFALRNNYGFSSIMPSGWTFNFNSLAPGNLFTVDIATVSATNAPAWGASGYAFIESLDQWTNTNNQHIRVTVNNAAVANTVFFTQGGSTPTWGTIK